MFIVANLTQSLFNKLRQWTMDSREHACSLPISEILNKNDTTKRHIKVASI